MAESILLVIADWLGAFAFGISGAIMAIKKKMDLFGVLMMALTTAFGGGIVRDLMLGVHPPKVFSLPGEVAFVLICAFAVFFVYGAALRRSKVIYLHQLEWIMNFFDAVGLGAFAVVGTIAGLNHNGGAMLCISLGTITAVGGGVLRDVFCQEIPGIFRKHIYAVAAILGSLCCYLMAGLSLPPLAVDTVVISLVTIVRMAATIRHWDLPTAAAQEVNRITSCS